jgi:transcriptional regulator with XRE-family HTH domain
MGRRRRWTQQGEWMRDLREKRGLNPREVERETGTIAELNRDDSFHVSRSYLRNIELGESMPSRPRMRSLAQIYGQAAEEVGRRYGILLISSSSGLGRPNHLIDNEEERRVLLAVVSRFRSKQTVLLDEVEDAQVIPAQWREKPGGKLRFAVIGTEDDSMGELLPAGSLAAIDTQQKTIDEGPWNTVADRPIYLVSQDDVRLHICCFAYQVGSTLTLLSYQPTGTHEVAHKKTPKDAEVVGRVVRVWQLPRDDGTQVGAARHGMPKAGAS